jgi:hypothetical protein
MLAAISAAKTKGYKYNKFNQSFHLNYQEKQYIKQQGYLTLEKQAKHIITSKLKTKPTNDGRQTPFRGNPIFKAQHATACSSRKAIQRWHRIPSYRQLTEEEIHHLTNKIMTWIRKEMKGITATT